ncbi:68ebef0f-803d-4480-b236-c169ae8407a9 [Thermothielavioides terrestris]|uniref:68ebef0f-803d-4480-b236-c169ae8407a9 n=1 Tax=Thermothielavioides terrestris TaxID=2587410 RepID=A0A3S5CX91_9PEZI|nr:68ebef0f-803d-4480-b236-c169ae8407a9 [Thermothielavioides terrestris]
MTIPAPAPAGAKPAALHFREATPADIPLIEPLVQSAYRGDESRQGWTTEADVLAGPRIDAAGILAKITAPDSAILLAIPSSSEAQNGDERAGTDDAPPPPVACCEVARRGPRTAYFGLFAVSPRRQGGGIGRQVLAHAERYCRARWAAEVLEMSVIWTRVELIAWYERRGYRRTGETREFPHDEMRKTGGVALREGLYMIVMQKDLRDGGDGDGAREVQVGVGKVEGDGPAGVVSVVAVSGEP